MKQERTKNLLEEIKKEKKSYFALRKKKIVQMNSREVRAKRREETELDI